MDQLFRPGSRVHGSIYPGASGLQDWDYAATVAASQQKPPPEATVPEPIAGPPLSKTSARGRKRT